MAPSYGLEPAYYQPVPYQSSSGSSVERYRPRTPVETVDDAYDAMVQVTTLHAVTHAAYDSVATVVQHKDKLLRDHPGAEAGLNALGFAHVHGLMAIQRQVTDNVRRSRG